VPGVEKDGKLYRYTPIDTCWELGIAKNSKNPEAAYAVLYFLMRPDNALERVMAPTAKVPSSNHDPYAYSQFYSPRWRAEKPWVGPFLDAELEALKTPYPLLRVPGGFEYLDALDLAVSECLAGTKDAKSALDDAAAKWEEITDRLGRDRQKDFYHKMWMVPLVF
jgi:multiple sugar transport system substrate-binding protein